MDPRTCLAFLANIPVLSQSFRTSVAEDAPEFNRDPASLAKGILDANAVAQERGIVSASDKFAP